MLLIGHEIHAPPGAARLRRNVHLEVHRLDTIEALLAVLIAEGEWG